MIFITMLLVILLMSLCSVDAFLILQSRHIGHVHPGGFNRVDAVRKFERASIKVNRDDSSHKKRKSLSRPSTSRKRLDEDDREELIRELVDQMIKNLDNLDETDSQDGIDSDSDCGSDLSLSKSKTIDQNDLLNGVVRVYCTHSQPNFGMPWQRLRQGEFML